MSKEQEFKVEMWSIDKIIPYPGNVKIHNKEQVARIAQSLALGWDQPIVVDKDGVIIKGHGRRLASILNGWTKVPVYQRFDLSPEQVRAMRLADNRVAVGDIDPELLRKELETLDFDMKGIFDEKELEFLSADLGTLNENAFVADLETEVKKQSDEAAESVNRADARPVPIAEALGFKSITGKDQRVLARFMARIESQFNLPADKAFLAFVNGLMENA